MNSGSYGCIRGCHGIIWRFTKGDSRDKEQSRWGRISTMVHLSGLSLVPCYLLWYLQ